MSRVVFGGVGKTVPEIEYGVRSGILFFTVESEGELARISKCAQRLKLAARVAIRVNPDVQGGIHRYVTTGKKENKFGIPLSAVPRVCALAARLPGIELVGLHCHLGSQILSTTPFVAALEKLSVLCLQLGKRHAACKYIDIGGGLGIGYKPGERGLKPGSYAKAVVPVLRRLGLNVVIEPGRYLVGNAGMLVCEVQYVKRNGRKTFVIVDAAMNDLLRPALYNAYHEVLPLSRTTGRIRADLVGPVCESGDFLAQDRVLPAVRAGALLGLKGTGAYGYAMASNYNCRPRPAEVIVDGDEVFLARRRETWQDLISTQLQ